MNAGFSGVERATYSSTGIDRWAVLGSRGKKVFSSIERANSHKAIELARGEKTNICPS
jgi:hypothetical protein